MDRQYDVFADIDAAWKVIDIGAGIGDFAVHMSARVRDILAFEPDDQKFDLAHRNIALNCRTNITVVRHAVLDLDTLFVEHSVFRCELLKIDCEGCEHNLFEKVTEETLRRIDRIVMEVHLPDEPSVVSYSRMVSRLLRAGFRLTERRNPVHCYLRLLCAERLQSATE